MFFTPRHHWEKEAVGIKSLAKEKSTVGLLVVKISENLNLAKYKQHHNGGSLPAQSHADVAMAMRNRSLKVSMSCRRQSALKD